MQVGHSSHSNSDMSTLLRTMGAMEVAASLDSDVVPKPSDADVVSAATQLKAVLEANEFTDPMLRDAEVYTTESLALENEEFKASFVILVNEIYQRGLHGAFENVSRKYLETMC
jgi:hypothetical protein